MLLYDCSHTCHCTVNTGIQRVVRKTYKSIQGLTGTTPVCLNPYIKKWKLLDGRELEILGNLIIPKFKTRSAYWTVKQKLLARFCTFSNKNFIKLSDSLFVPEVFKPNWLSCFGLINKMIFGSKIAVFHDAIPINFPTQTPIKTVEYFPFYLEKLLHFDGIAAISINSRKSLTDYWDKNYPDCRHPDVKVIPLGSENVTVSSVFRFKYRGLRESTSCGIIFVSSLEGRKNHLSLLEAANILWKEGICFRLNLIGILNKETGSNIIDRINYLKSSYNRPVKWLGSVDDSVLVDAYRNCTFTVYPSLYEGFGLPVIESLRYGKPCLCTPGGALKEVSSNGGCHIVEDFTAQSISKGIKLMLTDHGYFCKLKKEALAMTFRTWSDYSKDILRFIEEIKFSKKYNR